MAKEIQQITQWLEERMGRTIAIDKREQDDLDSVQIELSGVDYRDAEAQGVIDDYLDSAFILRGLGSTLNAEGERVPLPTSSYEIAVPGLSVRPEGDSLVLHTERAEYTLSPFGE
ncbi:hypothetical protein F4V43_06535 [Paenibacillus spiritus]|uniref:Uncharacterized protein n=1 Tax=Paenibacillus spiritus TaxID=2496557 RepID=A0A5J5GEK6_9BACL|nr:MULTISPECIES: hypothetical protein [Paenibacillus]KAA9006595.1 hypothetical protein F4V43_06535 [Paenibacillus spiritus]